MHDCYMAKAIYIQFVTPQALFGITRFRTVLFIFVACITPFHNRSIGTKRHIMNLINNKA
jgi:hypothetical protein